MDPIIGHDLKAAVINTHREVSANLGAELAAPGEVKLRAEINNGFSRIAVRHAVESVLAFVFARDKSLDRESIGVVQRKVHSRPASPGQVIGILMAEIALG